MMYGNGILNKNICSVIVAALAIISDATAANVVPRPTTANRVSVSRPSAAASRMPTMAVKTGNSSTTTSSSGTTQSTTTTTSSTITTVAPVVEPITTPAVDTSTVENKSAIFGSTLTSASSSERDSAAASLADLVRAQRAALDAADATLAMAAATDLSGTGENTCDSALRECMMQKCGANFSKCVGDTDTTFFDKMDSCRRSTDCTGHEYQLFSVEIKADRDLNAKLATYNATIDCGNNYDACIVSHCGATYSKCIGKSAGDDAIARCESIAKACTEYDSGLAMRAMGVFGELRQTAERQIATDEQRLYALREQMRSVCTRLGAMFDERSLDCVYTVNFYAGDDSTLFASKKLYAGSTFDCTQNWFGIDITTFRENAFRTTRAQTSASSAMLGSGLGQAAGAITSGAIDRAIQRYKAENALDDAIQDCIDNGYDDKGQKLSEEECRAMKGYKSQTTLQKICEGESGGAKGIWMSSQTTCACPDPSKQKFDTTYGCVAKDFRSERAQESTARSADFFDDDADYADCDSGKDWYPLPRSALAGPNEPIPYTYLGYGFHQAENMDDPDIREILTTLENKCRNSGGTFYTHQESMQSLNIQNVCGTYNKYQRVMCLYGKNIAPGDTCNKVFNMSTVTVEYDNDPNKPALSSGYNACNFKYKRGSTSQRTQRALESTARSAVFSDNNAASDAGASNDGLFGNLMKRLQANKINITNSNERDKIKMFVDSSLVKDKDVKPGYPAVETAPSATGIKYYLHLDYPSLTNRTDNEHGAFCLELDKSICSGANSNCEVTYTGRSKCTFAYRL